jgi:hypothetical protein
MNYESILRRAEKAIKDFENRQKKVAFTVITDNDPLPDCQGLVVVLSSEALNELNPDTQDGCQVA